MTLKKLPAIVASARPAGLTMRATPTALARYDKALSVTLKAAAPSASELDILGEIGYPDYGGTDAKMVKAALKAAGKGPITVYINSPGGDAFEGIAIYNLLREHPGQVTVRVLGEAASAASVIAMAGDKVEMGVASFMMIHSCSGIVVGNEADMKEFADVLAALDQSVAEVYARRSGMDVKTLLAMMKKETWLQAKEAVAKKLADTTFDDEEDGPRARAASARSIHAQTPAVLLAASGNGQRSVVRLSAHSPGASGSAVNSIRGQMKTTKEKIADFEAKRAANLARMNEIMALAGDSTLSAEQETEYDGLEADNVTITAHVGRLKKHEAMEVASAITVNAAAVNAPGAGGDAAAAAARAAPSGVITVASNAQKGIAFTRYVKALAMARGNVMQAAQIAESNPRWKEETPQVHRVLMTAVAGGDTTTAGWAAELVYNQNLVNEFIELLRPTTIIGKMTGMRQVPFNVRMSGQDSGGTAYWVGQGKAIPVSKLHTIEVTLGIAKAAGLMVITEELARSSAPSAEAVIRDDLMKTIRTFLDVQFVDPNVAAVTNVSPASITNGVTPIVPSGTNAAALRTDVQTLFKEFINANLDPTSGIWIMDTTQAMAISMMLNPLGQPEFPGINIQGGTFQGMPVITSMSANIPGSPNSGKMIILAKQDDILFADDGGLTVDASREASIEMTDAPTGDAAAGTAGITSLVSMFQTNSLALKLVRYINWKKRRSTAVSYIKEANYSG